MQSALYLELRTAVDFYGACVLEPDARNSEAFVRIVKDAEY